MCARGLATRRCGSAAATRVASPERGGVAVGDGGVSLHVAFCARLMPVSFPLSGKERRLAVSCVSIPRGSGSPLERSQRPCGYRTCLVHFWIVRFLAAIPTEYEGTRGTESATRQSTLLRESLGLVMLSAGSTLGLRVPNLRQRVFDSLDSLHMGRSRVPLVQHCTSCYL